MRYMSYDINEASGDWKDKGFNWWVQVSHIDARHENDCPHFFGVVAAKAYIREELLNEVPAGGLLGGGSPAIAINPATGGPRRGAGLGAPGTTGGTGTGGTGGGSPP